jgi:hypothetical protein
LHTLGCIPFRLRALYMTVYRRYGYMCSTILGSKHWVQLAEITCRCLMMFYWWKQILWLTVN